jgi:hypothetical protein
MWICFTGVGGQATISVVLTVSLPYQTSEIQYRKNLPRDKTLMAPPATKQIPNSIQPQIESILPPLSLASRRHDESRSPD